MENRERKKKKRKEGKEEGAKGGYINSSINSGDSERDKIQSIIDCCLFTITHYKEKRERVYVREN